VKVVCPPGDPRCMTEPRAGMETKNTAPTTTGAPPPAARAAGVREVAAVFLKLGLIGFGGPAAHIALMEEEVVRRRRWVTREKFLDLLGATNLIPGPNSTEMAIHLGHARAGWPGLLAGGACFILPAMLIVLGCAWAYVKFGALPDVAHILHGIKPVIIAVVVQAIWGLARTAAKSRWLAAVGVAALALGFLGVNELILLAAAGAAAALIHRALATSGGHGPAGFTAWWWPLQTQSNHPMTKAATATATGVVAAAGAASLGFWPVFWFFLKVGSVLYGSGYVLLAFLRADLVERWGWLSEAQLLDAIAVGQVTPGPVFTTATFIGYLLQGTPGALVATAGIFLPSFFFVAVSGPIIPRVRASPSAGAFLDGVNVASLALMTVVTWRLGQGALTDALGVGLAAVSAVVLLRYRVNSAWLILGGAAVGWLSGWWH